MKKEFSLYNHTKLDTSHVANLTLTLQYRREEHIRNVVNQQRHLEEIDEEKYPSTKFPWAPTIYPMERVKNPPH